MDDKKAAKILIELLKKPGLRKEEKEALESAIGILSWTYLGETRIKKMKEKRLEKINRNN